MASPSNSNARSGADRDSSLSLLGCAPKNAAGLGFEPKSDVLAHFVRCARLIGFESTSSRSFGPRPVAVAPRLRSERYGGTGIRTDARRSCSLRCAGCDSQASNPDASLLRSRDHSLRSWSLFPQKTVGLGFEPRRLAPPAFKAGAIGRSAIPPRSGFRGGRPKACRSVGRRRARLVSSSGHRSGACSGHRRELQGHLRGCRGGVRFANGGAVARDGRGVVVVLRLQPLVSRDAY
jgi:hypothetical protein